MMQIKQGFKLKEVCGERILVPMGENNVDFSKLIALNDSSYLLWRRMEKGPFTSEELVNILCEEYDVTPDVAVKDVENLIKQYRSEGVITDC